MPKGWKRRGREDWWLWTELPKGIQMSEDIDQKLLENVQVMRRERAERFCSVANPITYPELRAEQIRQGDLERIAYERAREREWEREQRRAS